MAYHASKYPPPYGTPLTDELKAQLPREFKEDEERLMRKLGQVFADPELNMRADLHLAHNHLTIAFLLLERVFSPPPTVALPEDE